MDKVILGDGEKYRVAMIRQSNGSGYWRMVLPSMYIDKSRVEVDVFGVDYDVEKYKKYHTVMIHQGRNKGFLHLIRQLRKQGKRVVFDMDDNLFNYTDYNSASKRFVDYNREMMLGCLKEADILTFTCKHLRDTIGAMVGKKKPMYVVPNALDTNHGWRRLSKIGSHDGVKRIFWQGGSSHERDWEVCLEALEHILNTRSNVRVCVMGCLPNMMKVRMNEKPWAGRVDLVRWQPIAEYFENLPKVVGDIGIAPLLPHPFNSSKSCIKWMEYSLVGMPTIASNIEAYSDIMRRGEGFLVNGKDEWIMALERLLDDKELCVSMVKKSRAHVVRDFDIRKVAGMWESVFTRGL